MSDMKVTIVTVVMNMAATIEDTFRSVQRQTYRNIEHVIIDGGSTDGTVDIIRKHEQQIAYWVSEPDSGIPNAFNKALDRSTGDVICFLNADDWYADETIARVVELFQDGAEAVWGDMAVLTQDNRTVVGIQNRPVYGVVYPFSAMFIGRSVYERIGRLDERFRIAFDWDYCLRMHFHGIKARHLPYTCMYFRYGGVSSGGHHDWRIQREMLTIVREWRARFARAGRSLPEMDYADLAYRRKGTGEFLRRRAQKAGIFIPRLLLRQMQKRRLLIWGTGLQAQECYGWLGDDKELLSAFVTAELGQHGGRLMGLPVRFFDARELQDKFIIIADAEGDKVQSILSGLGFQLGRDFAGFSQCRREQVMVYLRRFACFKGAGEWHPELFS